MSSDRVACTLLSAGAVITSLALSLASHPAAASESGQTYFAHGAQTVYAGLLPAPGHTQFYGYTLFFDGDSVRDADGERVPGLRSQGIAAAPRVVHTWKREFGGFKLSSGAFLVVQNAGLETPQGEEFATGPMGYGIEPVYLSRSTGNWHYQFGAIVYLPWGNFDAQSPLNTTPNRRGGALNAGFTWLPTTRWEASLNLGYEFKGRNPDTEYRDGAQAGATYGFSYRPFEDLRWDFGMSGFYTAQVEDDRKSGRKLPDSRMSRLAMGPKLGYTFRPGTAVIFQWHRELEVRNAARGNLFWLMFAFPLGSGAAPAPAADAAAPAQADIP